MKLSSLLESLKLTEEYFRGMPAGSVIDGFFITDGGLRGAIKEIERSGVSGQWSERWDAYTVRITPG